MAPGQGGFDGLAAAQDKQGGERQGGAAIQHHRAGLHHAPRGAKAAI